MQQKIQVSSIPINLIRTLAILQVIVTHASAEHPFLNNLMPGSEYEWLAVNFFESITRSSLPLFVMITGVLLLQPSKTNETIKEFFKKRISKLLPPFMFWAAIYFVWRVFYYRESLTLDLVLRNVVLGYPYYHFWFLYMLFGLYLVTPILRPIAVYSTRRVLKYLVTITFFVSAILPLLGLFFTFQVNPLFFVLGSWVGYFVLGLVIVEMQAKSPILYLIFLLGTTWTLVGTWILTVSAGGVTSYFFYDYLSASSILSSSAAFLLLCKVSPQWLEKAFPQGNRLINLIGQNTLAIYLLHVLILELFQSGLLGFRLSVTNLSPILEIPLISGITLGVCLAIIVPLKKIPILGRFIG